jgi:exopolyphosphatase/guanosine-5'-triphosphate,3'-diphosphate pyrophosphatase
MFDIGGGSTEVIFGSLSHIRYQHSFRIGTVRSHQMFPGADDAEPEAYRKAHAHAHETFLAIPDTQGVTFTGIGGTATALAAIDLGLKVYSASRVQGHILTLARAHELCAMLESKTKAQRRELVGLEEKRADVIVFGSIIMLEFMLAVDAKYIIVSDRDNQEGYLAWKLGL